MLTLFTVMKMLTARSALPFDNGSYNKYPAVTMVHFDDCVGPYNSFCPTVTGPKAAHAATQCLIQVAVGWRVARNRVNVAAASYIHPDRF
ncbi:hypothetical protein GR157_18610 [Burkholderia sp. 4701]|nr:hypothetical protein [Burkholderia sp. 4701]